MPEWFENEAFWTLLYPFMFSADCIERAAAQMEQLLALVEIKPTSILDLCCGPGRHSVALAKRGFRVTGVDKSSFLLEKATSRAQQENVNIEWIQDDMRNFVRPNDFDLIINMFTSFGYFDRKDEDLTVLRNIFRSLSVGGACLIDVIGKERLAQIFRPTTSETMDDGTIIVQRHEIFDDWSRIRNEWLLIKDGQAEIFRFHHTIYSGQELRGLLQRAGFQEIRLYGDLEGNPYGLDARRLIAVAYKHSD